MNLIRKGSKLASKALGGAQGRQGSDGRSFLHGYLHIEVHSAQNLPDMEGWMSKLVDKKDVTDAFVDVRIGNAKLVKTSVIDNSLNPVWEEDYRVEVCHFGEELLFEVRDKDHAYAEFIGSVVIPTSTLMSGQPIIKESFPIKSSGGKHKGMLKISVTYVSVAQMDRTYEVECYFPMHRMCNVTLYMDAHVPPNMPRFDSLMTPEGIKYEPASCWKDVYYTLRNAKKLICITGWAVWDQLHLFRGADKAIYNKTLGELLIEKANEEVDVSVMVWSEYTSGSILPEKGFMGTHDMETYNRFKNTKVKCALAPREISVNELTDYTQNVFSSGAYTHHQKSIIADADNGGGARRLVAFVGGLDLTGGRWDTPEFPLFSTLLNEHEGDFRNSNAKSIPETQGPREPWHDIHSLVEGPVAYDVLENFYERWDKQGTKYGKLNRKSTAEIDYLCQAPRAAQDPHRGWNVQFFRSITSDSAVFNPQKVARLNSKKGRTVDASIAQAYIQSIRNAQNFIYIENQYFLGSAYTWHNNSDTNCHHTIPSEITQKIVDKIAMNQRFTAYIVIPMFPEGDPASAPIQEILYWQTRTIEMMYKRVGDAIKQAGLNSHPTDWLLFMCPGKRELAGPHLNALAEPTDEVAKIMRDTMRFPIYVHSKMMIVDDAYIIVGSANINQRSMAGTRDTEMAVGCWQPSFPESHPFGEVHMFRRALWATHFMSTDNVLLYPGSIECVNQVKKMAYDNWQQYSSSTPGTKTDGQMLCYPLNVMPDGTLENLEGFACFPDFPGSCKIMGKKSAVIPQKVTT